MYFQNTWKLFATTCLRVSYKSLKTSQNSLIRDNLKNRQSVHFKSKLTHDRTTSDKWFTRHFVGKSMYFQNTWRLFATTCLRVSYKSLKKGQNALICDNLENRQSVHFKTRLTHGWTTSDKWFTRHFVGKSMYFQNTWKLFATTLEKSAKMLIASSRVVDLLFSYCIFTWIVVPTFRTIQ